ncbi:MAG: hypothetical protein AB7G75_35660, partial [Candidatus Binatia bacterium]
DSFPQPSLGPPPAEPADPESILGNSGFESDLTHSQWTATKPNKTYSTSAPVVNPIIVPKGKTDSLKAPAGNNFVGILNPKDQDISGKLVHTAVAGPFPEGTVFEVTIFANRGRLAGAKSSLFETSPSEVLVQFFGWGVGKLPTINPNTDDWSRRPSVRTRDVFTNWAANGEWASQTFQFVADRDLSYISLSVAGMNHKNASYVAFDFADWLTFAIPPGWNLETHGSSLSLSSPSTSAERSDPEAVHVPPDVVLQVLSNIEMLSITDFALQFDDGWFSNYISRNTSIIADRDAISFSDIGAEVGHAPALAVFVAVSQTRVLLITVPGYGSEISPEAVLTLDKIIASLKFE